VIEDNEIADGHSGQKISEGLDKMQDNVLVILTLV